MNQRESSTEKSAEKTQKKGEWSAVDFHSLGDHRGELVAIESLKNIPFEIKRVYYLLKTKPDVRRGFHAHIELDQILIAISGDCKVLVDDGEEKATFHLKDPRQGLRIKNLVWREMFDFSDDCVLLVLASHLYNENDYLRDYAAFLAEVRRK
jgi:dTDP-4-dehydrorhamnose 3,5-epimerase-like enzyme